MFGVRELNVGIELWGMAFCLIGIVCVLLFFRAETRFRNLFIAGFSAEFFAAGGDALAGMFRGHASEIAWVMTHLGNYTTFIGNFILVAVVTVYLCTRIEESGGPSYPAWKTGVKAAAGVLCILTLCGVFFTIDAENIYHRSVWYPVTLLYVTIVDVVNAALAILNRKAIGRIALACLLFYTLIPVAASVIQAFIYGLNFVIIAGVLGLIVVFFEMQSHSAHVLIERTEELAKSRVEVSESRIAVMVSQIQPHFIFNTLDTIYGLVDDDTELAKEAIASFSRYLRTNLDSLRHSSPVPIETEMEHVRTYLELERMSDDSRLSYEFDLQAKGFSVPPLSVQTLAENAIKHGLGEREDGGRVIIRTREQATEYTVAVIDNGVGFDVQERLQNSQRVGISNTRGRLAALCGGSLEITSKPGVGTSAVMHIPKEAKVGLI